MKTTILLRQVTIGDDVRALIEKKITKLDKFFLDNAEAFVTLSKKREKEILELTITAAGSLFRSEVEGPSFCHAIDTAVNVIERQIRKNKTRLARRLRQDAFSRTVEETSFAAEEPEEELNIVRIKQFKFAPMTREEAVLQMNLLEHNFFAFRDEDNGGTFAVVYKRNDGGYGIIEDGE